MQSPTLDRLLVAAQRVCHWHERREYEHHRMTTADFMRDNPDHAEQREKVLGKMNEQLTEAIWALGRALNGQFEKDEVS